MFNFFNFSKKTDLWDFHGGIHPPEMKSRSSTVPLRQIPLPDHLIIPLRQHAGPEGAICVKPGDHVLRGQPLTRGWGRMLPVHASTSGKIITIVPHPIAHPTLSSGQCVTLLADGEDRWIQRDGWHDYKKKQPETLIDRIHQFGLAGLGGAGFPAGLKLNSGRGKIHTLIINGAECEPYITADDRLMQECALQIVDGIRILAHILNPQRILMGIEDNKPRAISMMRAALMDTSDIQLRIIPTKYPSGSARQLTQILTGKQVPPGGHSSDIGVLMYNIGTVYAVKRAIIDGEPLTERVVTLTGHAIQKPGNVWARLGTPISHLLDFADYRPQQVKKVIMGGPLMGFTLSQLDVPVVKITNCLIAPSLDEVSAPQPEQGCIRCSACSDVCPAQLLPQQLYWFSQGGQHDKAKHYHLSDCIECGACNYVCPSHIPLVHYFRKEKATILEMELETKRTTDAKRRFETRKVRLAQEKTARLERHKAVVVQPSVTQSSAIQAALERVNNNKKQQDDQNIIIRPGTEPDNSEMIALRQARKEKALAHKLEKNQQISPELLPNTDEDSRKIAVEAAIARVKARKQTEVQTSNSSPAPTQQTQDPRKAAVDAAIARVKARKQTGIESTSSTIAEPQPGQDPRKAAIEAAIARVKARKSAQKVSEE